jgi:hypothetical protein
LISGDHAFVENNQISKRIKTKSEQKHLAIFLVVVWWDRRLASGDTADFVV